MRWTNGRAMASVWRPASATANPSASVNRVATRTGASAASPAAKHAAFAGSTPMICKSGLSACNTVATPASNPPPPTGTRIGFGIGNLFQDFKSQRPLPRDHLRIVKRMDVGQLAFLRQPIGFAARFVEGIAVQDHRRAELTATRRLLPAAQIAASRPSPECPANVHATRVRARDCPPRPR